MKTQKMSVGKIKNLGEFKAVSNAGTVAHFVVDGDVAVNQETEKKVKLDTIRRSWGIVIEDGQVDIDDELKEVQENQVVLNHVAPHNNESVSKNEEADKLNIEKGDKVKLSDGSEGIVQDIVGELATVVSEDTELPAKVESLELVEKNAADKMKQSSQEIKQEEEKPNKNKDKKKTSTLSSSKKETLEKILKAAQDEKMTNMKKMSETKAYLHLPSGHSKIGIFLVPTKKEARVEFRIRKGTEEEINELYNQIKKSEKEIEEKLGKLEWENRQDRKVAKMSISSNNNEDVEWMIETAKKFKEVLTPYAKK